MKAASATGMMLEICAFSAAGSITPKLCSSPRSFHSAMRRCIIQRPVMFCKKRIRPPTPPSLVNSALRASSVRMGSGNSKPSKDHVPELRKAMAPSPLMAGTAATAEAVSCEPTAITFIWPRPVSSAISSRSEPRTLPGITISPNIFLGNPKASMVSHDHSLPLASRSSEVEAMQYSLLAFPVRK